MSSNQIYDVFHIEQLWMASCPFNFTGRHYALLSSVTLFKDTFTTGPVKPSSTNVLPTRCRNLIAKEGDLKKM